MGNLDLVSPTFDTLRQPIHESSGLTPMSGSPYLVNMDWFCSYLGFNNHRKELIEIFLGYIDNLKIFEIKPTFALIGGSFVSDKSEPKDIDGVIAYTGSEKSDFKGIKEIVNRKNIFLDIRLVPEDTGGIYLTKILCYYHELYSRNRMKGRTSCVLIDISELSYASNK
ncbi:hypothetical protein [Sphingomonas sp. ABOLH]|uniref:DUF6932 family protein n=1 Tax=Sphingomonas sp. ABOLH TaxID=1985881 RepID=UPI000F7DB7A1|nr:hypothetical protein [Sphingomonas sp. ABOLH]